MGRLTGADHAEMNDNQLQQKIRDIVATAFRVTPEAVRPETSILWILPGARWPS